jgi:hypothetical protein
MYAGGQLPTTKSGRGAALALLLAVALVLCHGALGSHHLVHQPSTVDLHEHALGHAFNGVHGSASDAKAGEQAEGPGGGCSNCVAYFAILLVVSLGTVLGLVMAARPWTCIATPSLSRRLQLVPPVLHPARGLTLPVLQVFQL